MSLINTIKQRLNQAKADGAIDGKDADAVVGVAEGIDDELLYQLFKTLLLLLPAPIARTLYFALRATEGFMPEEWKEKLYFDELKAAAEYHKA